MPLAVSHCSCITPELWAQLHKHVCLAASGKHDPVYQMVPKHAIQKVWQWNHFWFVHLAVQNSFPSRFLPPPCLYQLPSFRPISWSSPRLVWHAKRLKTPFCGTEASCVVVRPFGDSQFLFPWLKHICCHVSMSRAKDRFEMVEVTFRWTMVFS